MGTACSCSNGRDNPSGLMRIVAKKKYGKYVAPKGAFPPGYREATLEALEIAETRKERPVHMAEIYSVFEEISKFPKGMPLMFIQFALYDLWGNDELLCDKEANRMSLNNTWQRKPGNETEFELYSDRFERLYASQFILNNKMAFRPAANTPICSFKYIKDLLLSKDLSRNAELDWAKDGNFRFLDGADMTGNQVAFTSFPRSGNTFLRRYLEEITGIYTGSDMLVEYTKNVQSLGLAGEGTGCDDNLVWITKTHYPMQSPHGAHEFNGQRQIVIMRNPIDSLSSFAHLMFTGTQSLTPKEEYYKDFPETWDTFLRAVTPVISESFKMLRESISKQIPTYYCRYEDLRNDPKTVLTEIFRFILDVPRFEGTVVEKRIQDIAAEGSDLKAIYKLKTHSNNMNRNAFMYSEEQMDYLKSELKDVLFFFGYTNHSSEHDTAFFNFTD